MTQPTLSVKNLRIEGETWPPRAILSGEAYAADRDEPVRLFVETSRGRIGEGIAARHEQSGSTSALDGGFELQVPFRRDVLWRYRLRAEFPGVGTRSLTIYLPWLRPNLRNLMVVAKLAARRFGRALRRKLPTSTRHRRWSYEQLRSHKRPDQSLREDKRPGPFAGESPVKCVAFYLPQFHPIDENNRWWGHGFTEWTNVTRALPQFAGHYQPHLPADLGFYDLRLPETLHAQIDMAKHFGIHGFCFYHYWFSGKRLLERPLDILLNDPSMNMPFCLCWANENWSRRWDGSEKDILMAQDYSEANDARFIDDLLPYLRDPRYIRIDDRPLLVVYRIDEIPDPARMLANWKARCAEHGIGEPYVVAAQTFGMRHPSAYGLSSAVEFPPHLPSPHTERRFYNARFHGEVMEYAALARTYIENSAQGYELFKTVAPCWDNTARKEADARIFDGCDRSKYAQWLREACKQAITQLPEDRRFVFINAWNEWAEGAHLEPDQRFGFAYLNATAEVLEGLQGREHA